MGTSGIEWTDATWNPATGCTKVSPGCAHCYAEAIAPRTFKGRPFTDVQFHPERLEQPLRWKKPRRVFVNSMSDLFHEDLSFEVIDKIFAVMACSSRHTFQALTKRPVRAREYLTSRSQSVEYWETAARSMGWTLKWESFGLCPFPLQNLWIGVSVENQAMANERIPILQDTPAAVRFLSVEPLLSEVDLYCGGFSLLRPLKSPTSGRPRKPPIDWVIVGGESGRQARPCHVKWVRSVIKQCRDANVSCFVKQLGSNPVLPGENDDPWLAIESGDGLRVLPIRNSKGGDPAEWPMDLRVREWPR